jgi:hypothetical protein
LPTRGCNENVKKDAEEKEHVEMIKGTIRKSFEVA